MLFNSLDFAIFLPIVFSLYWFATNKQIQLQNLLIVLASYIFYGWWDARFLLLIVFSTLVDYSIGLKLGSESRTDKRKLLLTLSLCINLGLLGFFKYYNFFIESFQDAFSFFGVNLSLGTLEIILPVGISFYTFQTLSYTIDVYRGKLVATKNFVAFSAFVSFFPQLVAGPIERATNLLPQFEKKRQFDYAAAIDGCKQILWGLIKKVVIADNCAEYVNLIFANSADYSGSTLLLGSVLFAFQIYGDFSGYSDIAIGTARLFGFSLMQNFAYPYFSRDIAEFWRRWHISLSTWFRDYLYIPLGGSKVGLTKRIRNTFVIFLVSGFWHGAKWTFVIWGGLNALYFLPLLLSNKNRRYLGVVADQSMWPSLVEVWKILTTFALTVLAWVFFRADSVAHALSYLAEIFSSSIFSLPKFPGIGQLPVTIILIIAFLLIEWNGRRNQYAIEKFFNDKPLIIRWIAYFLLLSIIYFFGNYSSQLEFIYFQF